MTKTKIEIEIVSDVMCPWCFIGKRHLEEAMRHAEDRYDVRVRWLPFQLNPDLAPEGMDRAAYFEKKFGAEHALRIYARIEQKGREAGIDFDFGAIRRTPNTFDAHRLIWHAQREGRGESVVEGLFQGFFLEGKDVGDRRILVGIAEAAGLVMHEAERFKQKQTTTTYECSAP